MTGPFELIGDEAPTCDDGSCAITTTTVGPGSDGANSHD